MFERFSLKMHQLLRGNVRETLRREDGQTVTEYALVLAFVAILLAAVLVVLQGEIQAFINVVGDDLSQLPGFS